MQIISPLLNLSSPLFQIIFLYFLLTRAADNFFSNYSNTSLAEASKVTKPGCLSKCGNLTVPYPFGIGIDSGCSINSDFAIRCVTSHNPPKAIIGSDYLEVLGITDTKIFVKNRVAWRCYNETGSKARSNDFSMNLSSTPFSFSTENKLTVVGCDDVALMSMNSDDESQWADYISSCVGICSNTEDLRNGFCAGIGCCQASIPMRLRSIYTTMSSLNDHEYVKSFSSCGYSFLADQNSYTFNIADISDSSFMRKVIDTVPLVLEWAIGNQPCDQIRDTDEMIMCQGASACVDSDSLLGGYRCNCLQGYHGNPYLSPGCQDINECNLDQCHPKAKCINLPGSFNCSCPPNYLGDGTKNGSGCIFLPPPKKVALFAGLLVGLGLFLLLVVSFWLYKMLKKRGGRKQKRELFKRNGGLLLKQQMSAHDSILEKMRIFTSKELERATDQFNESRILGRGGQGTVYKGMLSDGRLVAVKKSKQVNENQLEEFINEVVVLAQVNHRNVVKLLGCCLETEVPLLVYEFIPNGTLYQLIHEHDTGFPFSWDLRLRIAVEIANALSYLHYATSIPIYHRDMKSTNIILDEKYRAKISDFGISRLAAIDQTHLTTNVKGTFGYLDPEYFRTGKYTEKSDVYSFGVVLVELLTGQKPIETSTTEEERSLVTRFLLVMEDDRVRTILDSRIIEQGVKDEHIAVCDVARRCLNLNGKKRPTMREVASQLESISNSCENPSSSESNIQEKSHMDMESFVCIDVSSSSSSWTHNVATDSVTSA